MDLGVRLFCVLLFPRSRMNFESQLYANMDEKSLKCYEKRKCTHLKFHASWVNWGKLCDEIKSSTTATKWTLFFFNIYYRCKFVCFFLYSRHFNHQFQWVDIIIIDASVERVVSLNTLFNLVGLSLKKRRRGDHEEEEEMTGNERIWVMRRRAVDSSLLLPFCAAVPAFSSGGRPVPPSFQYGFSSNLCKPAWGNRKNTHTHARTYARTHARTHAHTKHFRLLSIAQQGHKCKKSRQKQPADNNKYTHTHHSVLLSERGQPLLPW